MVPVSNFQFSASNLALTLAPPPRLSAARSHTAGRMHESKIIMEHLEALKANGWIRKRFGPWGSSISLAAKPHQEHIILIDEFVWQSCASC
jgi:hypothetical protein